MTPSLSPPSIPDNPRLELRQPWSEIEPRHYIFNRLVVWRASTPISLQLPGEMGLDESLRQLATLLLLIIAGQETRDEKEHQVIRQTIQDLNLFSFNNADKALELFEGAWLKRRGCETLDENLIEYSFAMRVVALLSNVI
ncbi:transcriptional regulator family: Fungal Specific TF [Penicillium taxi]|uniref:transcriptional regulator family: Fungal Specific TF n=1 Tax=Penicillium taxi TaxID=168475 RepID=UPI00254559C6|nr:transcriptional regulator family: Fungal Specific TF [Penicillium taxi]KAJ5894914.1 transcriptional regulator family: Fungal Specific TF [Penicillium taxi]